MLWQNADGSLITDTSGNLIDCDTCPCAGAVPCPNCTVTGSEVQIEFTASGNLNGAGCDGNGDCSAWVNTAFNLAQLTQAQINNVLATWPTSYGNLDLIDDYGCVYGLFTGLPCGAQSMLFIISDGGGDGSATCSIWIGWADGTAVEIILSWDVSPPSTNCLVNFQNVSEYTYVGVGGFYTEIPCDFALLQPAGNSPEPIITMYP